MLFTKRNNKLLQENMKRLLNIQIDLEDGKLVQSDDEDEEEKDIEVQDEDDEEEKEEDEDKDEDEDEDEEEEFDETQLKMGIKVEHEHTDDDEIAEKIAKDHLKEDPQYYTKLKSLGL